MLYDLYYLDTPNGPRVRVDRLPPPLRYKSQCRKPCPCVEDTVSQHNSIVCILRVRVVEVLCCVLKPSIYINNFHIVGWHTQRATADRCTVVRRVRPRAEHNVRTYRFLPADTRYIRIWYIIRTWYHKTKISRTHAQSTDFFLGCSN